MHDDARFRQVSGDYYVFKVHLINPLFEFFAIFIQCLMRSV